MADWLAYGLDEALTDTPEIGVVRKIRPNSGLVRYEPRNETTRMAAGRQGDAGRRTSRAPSS